MLLSGGRLALGARELSGIFVTDDGCAWGNKMVRGDAPVSSLAVDAAGALLALTVQVSDGGTLRSSLLRSSDGGSTFDSFGPDLPDFVGATLKHDGLARDIFISNMEYVLAHAGSGE